jgi:hypothetical protein
MKAHGGVAILLVEGDRLSTSTIPPLQKKAPKSYVGVGVSVSAITITTMKYEFSSRATWIYFRTTVHAKTRNRLGSNARNPPHQGSTY